MSDLPAGVVLRPATVDDSEAAARMHMTCWREAYGPLVEPALLDAALADPAGWTARWRELIEAGGKLLAVHDAEIVGFATAGPARDPAPPADTELHAIYLRAAWHGTGVGQALLDAALGDRAAYVWVLEGNARAAAFYARNGFRFDGGRQPCERLGGSERRMVRGSMPA